MLLQLLIVNTPCKEFRVESRNEELGALEQFKKNLAAQVFIYFQEPILL